MQSRVPSEEFHCSGPTFVHPSFSGGSSGHVGRQEGVRALDAAQVSDTSCWCYVEDRFAFPASRGRGMLAVRRPGVGGARAAERETREDDDNTDGLVHGFHCHA